MSVVDADALVPLERRVLATAEAGRSPPRNQRAAQEGMSFQIRYVSESAVRASVHTTMSRGRLAA
jgi:hypothetical protein